MFEFDGNSFFQNNLSYFWPVWGDVDELIVGDNFIPENGNISFAPDRFGNPRSALRVQDKLSTNLTGFNLQDKYSILFWIKIIEYNENLIISHLSRIDDERISVKLKLYSSFLHIKLKFDKNNNFPFSTILIEKKFGII